MGGAHAWRLKSNPDAQIVALCDVSPERVDGLFERHLKDYEPGIEFYTDAAKMYSEVKPDGVIIVTPHTLHYDHAVEALGAGCNVLMEKPMVTCSEEARRLKEVVEKSGLIFIVGYNTPCTPEFNYLRDAIRKKELGRLETVTGWQSQDWRRATSGTWRQDPKLSGGGQMYDSGAHMFNSLVWSIEKPVAEVTAFIDNVGTPVDINGVVNIRFVDGTFAVMTISGNSNPDGAGMYYIFEDGRIEIDGWGGSWIRIFRRGEGQVKYPQIVGKPQTATENFVEAILGNAEPKTSVINGVIQSELMDAIYESAKNGSVVKVKSCL